MKCIAILLLILLPSLAYAAMDCDQAEKDGGPIALIRKMFKAVRKSCRIYTEKHLSL